MFYLVQNYKKITKAIKKQTDNMKYVNIQKILSGEKIVGG